jgi:hypothetical protein
MPTFIPCCEDFGRFYGSDRRELGVHITRFVKEPPHYDPPRYFLLSFHAAQGGGSGLQICFCPFCGRDLNELWRAQFSK